jgi:hypothetical protein
MIIFIVKYVLILRNQQQYIPIGKYTNTMYTVQSVYMYSIYHARSESRFQITNISFMYVANMCLKPLDNIYCWIFMKLLPNRKNYIL